MVGPATGLSSPFCGPSSTLLLPLAHIKPILGLNYMRAKYSGFFPSVFLRDHFSLLNYFHSGINQKNAATVEGKMMQTGPQVALSRNSLRRGKLRLTQASQVL